MESFIAERPPKLAGIFNFADLWMFFFLFICLDLLTKSIDNNTNDDANTKYIKSKV